MASSLLWCCAEKNASWSAKEVFGRCGMAVGNPLINHRWFTKYYLPQIITSHSALFTYHGPNHPMILLHQSFRQVTPSEYLPAPPSTDCALPCKVLTPFWSLRCQFHNCFYTSKVSVPRAPLGISEGILQGLFTWIGWQTADLQSISHAKGHRMNHRWIPNAKLIWSWGFWMAFCELSLDLPPI